MNGSRPNVALLAICVGLAFICVFQFMEKVNRRSMSLDAGSLAAESPARPENWGRGLGESLLSQCLLSLNCTLLSPGTAGVSKIYLEYRFVTRSWSNGILNCVFRLSMSHLCPQLCSTALAYAATTV